MADLAPQLIAAIKGDKGLYPVNGGYVSTVAYRKDTVLRDNGSQWRALQLVPPATPPGEGAYWTKFVDGTPVADAAQVAADRVLSQAAAATASAAMDSVSALALLVGGYATAAQISAQSAAAVSGLAKLSAAAIAILLDSNTVAAHVYDTARDDVDWVGKVTNSLTSMPLGTATRGSKSQYPRLSIIAALGTARQIVVYDADDQACPMWWTLNEGTTNLSLSNTVPLVTGISAKNGLITISSSTAGLLAIDLIADRGTVYRGGVTPNCGIYQGNLADANSGKGYPGTLPPWFGGPPVMLTSGVINHLLLAVPPGTLPNPDRFGMPNPMCITACASGICVLRPDGVTVASASTTAFGKVSLDKNFNLIIAATTVSTTFVWLCDYPAYMTTGFALQSLSSGTAPSSMTVSPTSAIIVKSAGERLAFGAATAGLTVLSRHRTILANSMAAYIDDWKNPGYLIGAAKAAYTESSRQTSNIQSVEMFANGTFATDISGSTNDDLGTGFAPSAWDAGNGGRMKLERVNGTNRAGRFWAMPTVVGQSYQTKLIVSGAIMQYSIGTTGYALPVGTNIVNFVATSTTTNLTVRARDDGTTTYLDDISMKAVIADRTFAAANSMEVTGTLNRSVVASGAELAAVNGFSTSNYAQAPYSASLDPGSGEFSVGCAVVTTAGITKRVALLDRSAISQTGAYYRLFLNGSGWPSFIISDGTNVAAVSASTPLAPGPHRIRGIRRASPARIEIEVDGQIVATTALTTMGSLNNASAVLRLGLFTDGTSPMDVAGPGLTLYGVSMTAPSIEQMRAAYADEIQMFQANAKCLLQGGSGVQDIAYDPDIDLIYVAKSAGGTDVFQGLVNRGTILSTLSANLMPGGGTPGAGTSASAATASQPIAGPSSWGSGKAIALSENASNATHVLSFPSPVIPAGSCVQGVAVKAGTRNWVCLNTTIGYLYVNLTDGSTGAVGAGGTALSSVSLGSGWWLIQVVGTGTGAASIFRVQAANANNSSTYTGDGGANPAIYIGDAMVRIGSTPLTAADFQFAMSRNDNHKAISAHDGNVVIVTGAGADVVMPALALRERLRARRSLAANDPNLTRFNGRVTSDATPTFVGDLIYVPEGGKVDAIVSVTAAVPGGTATELLTTLLKVRANRDIGAAAATVFCSVISGSPSLPDKTTGTMDLIVASMGGGWIGVRATGKAATTIEWFGEQRLTRAA